MNSRCMTDCATMTAALINIGLPVRNGQAYLADAIESLLAQTCDDFTLTIYDNASTDDTFEIAQQFAARDPRVRVVRHEHNIGGVRNFVLAAEQATAEYFCWMAHDDLREPTFLERMLELFRIHPDTALACCAVRDIDPDGTPRTIRPETALLRTMTSQTDAAQRLVMYLQEAPGTPFYGLFRTHALKAHLHELQQTDDDADRPLLGMDMIFLAGFLRAHGLVVSSEPLIHFRRGGLSHRIDLYHSLRDFLYSAWRFHRMLADATRLSNASIASRWRVRWARWHYVARYFLSQPMRRMLWHYLSQAMPILAQLHAWWAHQHDPAFVRLRQRAKQLPAGSRIVLFGAGKHTQRCLPIIRRALGQNVHIVGIVDDHKKPTASIGGFPIFHPSDLQQLQADVLLISSDTYESALAQRAAACRPDGASIWCIHDLSLEASANDRSCSSTNLMNDSSSSAVSQCVASSMLTDCETLACSDSQNAMRC